jgi:hypothetical protein
MACSSEDHYRSRRPGVEDRGRFLGLGLKTKRVSVCRLHHKIDGGRSAWDTHQDLAACFM